LNSRSASSAEIPDAAIRHAYERLVWSSSWPDRITSFARRRSVTDCIASMPFITKLMITCLQLEPDQPRIVGTAGVNSNRKRHLNGCPISRCTKAVASLTTSLMSSGTFSMSVLFASARTRPDHLARPNAVVDDPIPPSGALLPGREFRDRASADRPRRWRR